MENHLTHPERAPPLPLVVDVDGTLVSGDLLVEGTARLLAAAPFGIFGLLICLAGQGRAALKRSVARNVPLAPSTLALNPLVLREIAEAQAAGRAVWLASAADALAVAPLASEVGAAGYLASDGRTNLTGDAKAAALVERFGARGFDYMGNERRDLAVWRQARHAVGVGLSTRLAREVRTLDSGARLLPKTGGGPRDWLRALRPHHWVKNLLVFTPLIAAHETGTGLLLTTTGMCVALSACASGTYLLNDLLDLPHDRRHASKCHRPLAAGKVALLPAMGLGAVLMAGGLALAFALSRPGGLCVVVYLILTLAYSLSLKRKLFVDVVTLGLLYMVRVVAGGMAISVTLSPWFLAFFLFAFFSLAIVKRLNELQKLCASFGTAAEGRAWRIEDLPPLAAFGAAAGVASVIVFALYIRSPEVYVLYARPEILWLMCPLLVWWMGRMMLLANRGALNDDPVVFTLRDRTSWITALAMAAVFLAAL